MALVNQRTAFKSTIVKIAKFSNSITDDTDVADISINYDRLVDVWNKYEDIHMQIMNVTGPQDIDFQMIEYNDTEDLYMAAQATLKRALNAKEGDDGSKSLKKTIATIASTPVTTQNDPISKETDFSGLRVPRMKVPEFSGEYQEWPSFRDLFMSLVGENPKVPNVQKLSYLKSILIGDTKKLIRSIKVTDANFTAAWDILKERFENERIIVMELLNNIYSIPNADGNAAGIKLILDTTTEALRELKNLKRPTDKYDDWLVFLIVKKLDVKSLGKWNELIGDSRTVVTWNQLKEFLTSRFRILEGSSQADSTTEKLLSTSSSVRSSKLSSCHVSEATKKNEKLKCFYCGKNHRAKMCFTFKKKQPTERRKLVESANLCINCLSPSHKLSGCSSTRSCFKCGQRHHSMLHVDSAVKNDSNVKSAISTSNALESTSSSSQSSISNHLVEHILDTNQDVLLATAIIVVKLDFGKSIALRALLDQGSQMSLITSFAATRLRLRSQPYAGVPLSGAGGEIICSNRGVVNFTFYSRNGNSRFQTPALVLDTVSQYQKSNSQVFAEASKKFPQIELADPNFDSSDRIDVLLGADIYAQVVLEGIKKFCGILVQNTSLGWILSGQYQKSSDLKSQPLSIHHSNVSMDKLIRSFWEIEEISTDSTSLLSIDELACEKHYRETHYRNSKGRFVVRLPFNLMSQRVELGYSRGVAVSSQIRMENRFKKNPILKEKYVSFMSESLTLGHMELVPENKIDKPSKECFYMPHHAVFRESQTTAIRVVFNASQKSSTGISLNDLLYTGPKLQSDLFNVLTRFRKYEICYMADIEKMYRRILVHRDDRDYQRIVWRENSNEEMKTYRLRVVTDGTSSAPFMAIRTVQQLAIDEKSNYPLAHETLMEDMFMDDMLSGSNDIQSGIEHIRQVNEVFTSAGMRLRKWASNVDDVLNEIPTDNRQSLPIEFGQMDYVKVLGTQWFPSTDHFSFKVTLPPSEETTSKRKLLSHASKLFDPLGFISPCTIIPKILMQILWELDLKWDDPLPPEITKRWLKFRNQLPQLEQIKIPRFIGPLYDEHCNYEIHGFSDASKDAYSAVVYTRIEHADGTVKVNFVAAKTKVAPIKKVAIPCLELCGAVLVSRLIQKIKVSLKVDKIPMFGWTDSEIVLGWLKSNPGSWRQFVGNRTSEILDILPFAQWDYVESTSNPADCASRGILPNQLVAHPLWWNGPEWLRKAKSQWPSKVQPIKCPETDLMKKISVNNVTTPTVDPRIEFLQRYSSLQKLTRITAWCMRFIINCRKRISERSFNDLSTQRVQALSNLHHGGPRKCRSKDLSVRILDSFLRVGELRDALNLWIKNVQEVSFPEELKRIKENKSIRRGKLRKLNPKLDMADNILRVGGRLTHARIPSKQKYPIVLPKHNHLTSLIIADTHITTLHGHVTLMLNYLRQKYWILGARQVVRRHVVGSCKICIKLSRTKLKQKMSDLPPPRVIPSRLFSHTAVDYAGPIYINNRGRGKNKVLYKGYIAVFICLSTKVIHLEAAEDYSTREFLETFKRFTSRRAIPQKMYSDNGTNFVGSATELSRAEKRAMREQLKEIAAILANDHIEWEFNPPSGSHFGGVYEAAVKSMKYHLKRILGGAHLTFKELQTVLCQIECALNSRPLCPLTDDVNDLNVLTPGHFITGTALSSLPEESLLDINENRLVRWQRMQQMFQDFWKHWSVDYLSGLQSRQKWFTEEDNLKVGELVILKEDDVPPTKWLMARVAAIHPGRDNLVRVVTLRFGSNCSVLTRPIHKLCRLPFLKPDELDYGF